LPRIHVTGNAGSGKTTLSHEIGVALGLPVYGLDKIVWRPGWVKTPPDERRVLEDALIAEPAWVIDGVSERVRRAADIVIFLDVGPWPCLTRCLRRNLPYLFTGRPDLPEHCPEILILPDLIRLIRNFPRKVRPMILADFAARPDTGLILRTPEDRKAALRRLGVPRTP